MRKRIKKTIIKIKKLDKKAKPAVSLFFITTFLVLSLITLYQEKIATKIKEAKAVVGQLNIDVTSGVQKMNKIVTGSYSNCTGELCVAGNVGIGVTSPGYKLQVSGSNDSPLYVTNSVTTNVHTARFYAPNLTSGQQAWLVNGVGTGSYNHAHMGFYYAGSSSVNNAMRLGLAGIDVMTLRGDGNVGIGTINPTAKLEVRTSGNENPNVQGLYVFNPSNSPGENSVIGIRTGGSSGGNPYISWDIANEYGWSMGIYNPDNSLRIYNSWNNNGDNTTMVIQPDRSVIFQRDGHSFGANTASLELKSPYLDSTREVSIRFHQESRWWSQIRARGDGFRFTSGGDDNLISLWGSELKHPNGRIYLAGNLHIDSYNGNNIYLNYYGSGNTLITKGNVGIGTTNPLYKVDISQGGARGLSFRAEQSGGQSATLGAYSLSFTSSNFNIYPEYNGSGLRMNNGGEIFLEEGMYSGGNLYIAPLSANGRLAVGTTVYPNAKVRINFLSGVNVSGNADAQSPQLRLSETGSGNYSRFQFDNNGNFWWHVAAKVNDNDSSDSRINFYYKGAYDALSIRGNGNIYFSPGLASTSSTSGLNSLYINTSTWQVFRYTSSLRYKTNIEDLKVDFEKLLSLRPVKFNDLNNNYAIGYGLIAEEVAQVLPEIVEYNAQGQPEGVSYQLLSVFQQKIIKQHHLDIDNLKENYSKVMRDLSLTSTGDLDIKEAQETYQVENKKENRLIERIAAFAEIVVGKIRVGIIEAKKIVINGIDVVEKIRQLEKKIDSQQKEIEELKKEIKELKKKME